MPHATIKSVGTTQHDFAALAVIKLLTLMLICCNECLVKLNIDADLEGIMLEITHAKDMDYQRAAHADFPLILSQNAALLDRLTGFRVSRFR